MSEPRREEAVRRGGHRLLVLSDVHLSAWAARNANDAQPGGELPYGMQALTPNVELVWTDAVRGGGRLVRVARIADGLISRAWPGLRGVPDAVAARRLAHGADAVMSVFEDAGLAFARLAPVLSRARPGPAHVMVCCWLSEDCAAMGPREVRSVRRSLAGVARIVVFSSNQVPILRDRFGIPTDRIVVVPFGVDTSYYDPSEVDGAPGGGGIVAVGSDSRRDYATLFEASAISGLPMTVACQPRNIAGLTVPSGVRVVSAYGKEYRRLLHFADLVVTPTVAPAYPSGQSVVLEAMSMGRPTLTTDSPAMREYVRDGWDGALMPARDAAGVAERLSGLMSDPALRETLGRRGAESVRAAFDCRSMWEQIGKVLRSVVD